MTTMEIPFAKPSINQLAIDEVVACLESSWLTTGPRVAQFEKALSHYFQSKHTLALSSATAGLHLALLGLHLQPGDEVITTPLTFVATANCICIAGGKPIFVDIDPKTLNIDVNKIKAAITPRTRAILPVHFAGLPVDLDPLYALAEQHGLRVIEDVAHAIGARYKNRQIGSFGDTHVFSFHPNKNMTTGEGGCVTTHDDVLANFIKQASFHGIQRPDSNSPADKFLYDVVMPGFKYNMMDLQAALGIHQLAQLEEFNRTRLDLVKTYQAALSNRPEFTLPEAPAYNHQHAWHLYTPLLNFEKTNLSRKQFIEQMKEHHINVGIHYPPVHLFSFYADRYGYKKGDFPHAENITSRIVSLPLYADLTAETQNRVIETIIKIFRS